jgi:hypothetical protein
VNRATHREWLYRGSITALSELQSAFVSPGDSATIHLLDIVSRCGNPRDLTEPYPPEPVVPWTSGQILFRGPLAQQLWLSSPDHEAMARSGEIRCSSIVRSRIRPVSRNPMLRPLLQSRLMMEHAYHVDDHVRRQTEGPQGRDVVEQSNVYTILALLPVEADGRLRYRVKSKEENFERIVTEDSLSRLN